jgi:hypothetical protein
LDLPSTMICMILGMRVRNAEGEITRFDERKPENERNNYEIYFNY